MTAGRLIEVERRGDVFCVRLRRLQLEEPEVAELAAELIGLVADGGCCRMALGLGPEAPEFLYSVFLAKMISLQRTLRERGGEVVLCYANPEVRSIFEVCRLDTLFTFLPDFDAAVEHWKS